MTSGTSTGSNAFSSKSAPSKEDRSAAHSLRGASPSSKHTSSPRTAQHASAKGKSGGGSARHSADGDVAEKANGHDESEAETLRLSDGEQDRPKRKKKAIKAEDEDDDAAASAQLSSSPRQRRKSITGADRSNGVERRSDERNGHKKLPNGSRPERSAVKSTSPSNRSHSKQSVASSEGRRKSPSAEASERDGASVTGSRKRKLREEAHPRTAEPPRQRLKSDTNAKSSTMARGPTSPTVSSPGLRSHKRTASNQTVATTAANRTRREASSAHDRKWRSDSSSESSASPQPTTPTLQFASSRTKRSSNRSAISPARSVPQLAHKKNVDKFGATRLAREAEKGNLDLVKAAYEAAPEELNQEDFAGFAPLQKASLNGHIKVIDFLIKKGCRTDCHSKELDTPLIDAVENGHWEVVKLLLDAGVNPHHQNKNGERAVDVLNHEKENVGVIEKALRKAMLEHASDDDGMSVDAVAPSRDLVEDQRNDLLYVESTLSNLRKYAAKGDAVAVDHFLSSIAPDTACVTGAARGGHEMVLNLLLAMPSDRMEKDPDPAKNGETPLTAAIGRGHLGILRILLDQDNFNPARRTKEGKFYWELAEERKGPKWQQEVDLLRERFDEYRAKRQAAKKRSMGPHAAEKASKIAKLRSPRSPETKKTAKTSSPAPSADAKADAAPRLKIKQEKGDAAMTGSTVKKVRPTNLIKQLEDAPEATRKDSVDSLKTRRRRVVEEDESSDDEAGSKLKKGVRPATRPRKASEASSKTRKDASAPASTSKTKSKDRHSTGSSHNKENQEVVGEDDVMSDVPVPIPVHVENVKQHTPEPVRLRRIAEAEKEADRQRMAAERERLAQEQRAAEAIAKRLAQERQERLEKLPNVLRLACEKGRNRPLHFAVGEMGISMSFLPLHTVSSEQFDAEPEVPVHGRTNEDWMLSFQAVGILGLPEPDVSRSHPDWEARPVSEEQRKRFLRAYDISLLTHSSAIPCEDDDDFDHLAVEAAKSEARAQFLAMEHLAWIKVADFEAAVAQEDWLRDLQLTRSPLCINPSRTGADTPRTLEEMIRGVVRQHQQDMLTPPSAMDASPKVEAAPGTTNQLKGSAGAAADLAPAADPMDVDPPRKDEVAPASSGIV